MPSSICRVCTRKNGSSDMLKSTMAASSGTKPVRDAPELSFKDRFQKVLDRALYNAILDGRNTQRPEFSRFPWLGNQLAPRGARPICANAQFGPKFLEELLLPNSISDTRTRHLVDPSGPFAFIRGNALPGMAKVAEID